MRKKRLQAPGHAKEQSSGKGLAGDLRSDGQTAAASRRLDGELSLVFYLCLGVDLVAFQSNLPDTVFNLYPDCLLARFR